MGGGSNVSVDLKGGVVDVLVLAVVMEKKRF